MSIATKKLKSAAASKLDKHVPAGAQSAIAKGQKGLKILEMIKLAVLVIIGLAILSPFF